MPPTKKLTGLAARPDSGVRIPYTFFDTEQREAVEYATKHGGRTFITGPAGTGKTIVLLEIIGRLRRAHSKVPAAVAVIAPTGQTALALNGLTLHSWLGISADEWDNKSAKELAKAIRAREGPLARLQAVECLVMDEVPYLTAEAFDRLERVIRIVKGETTRMTFGGIQVVMAGDFFQLGPIGKAERGTPLRAAFEAKCWDGTFDRYSYFTKRYRHRLDPKFCELLDAVRRGQISDEIMEEIKALERPLEQQLPAPIELCPTRAQVDETNMKKLKALNTRIDHWHAVDVGEPGSSLFQDCPSPAVVALCRGTPVVLTKSLPEIGLPNGTMGLVVSLAREV
ncbi:hypothetical protein CF326_g9459, partial [Tilletia indica]